MKKYESKPVIHHEQTLTAIICDTCNSKVDADIYFDVTTRHSHWGNDSVESIEHHEFCSYPCMKEHMDDYFSDAEKTLVYDIEVEETP